MDPSWQSLASPSSSTGAPGFWPLEGPAKTDESVVLLFFDKKKMMSEKVYTQINLVIVDV